MRYPHTIPLDRTVTNSNIALLSDHSPNAGTLCEPLRVRASVDVFELSRSDIPPSPRMMFPLLHYGQLSSEPVSCPPVLIPSFPLFSELSCLVTCSTRESAILATSFA
jgi:hypothetical protein